MFYKHPLSGGTCKAPDQEKRTGSIRRSREAASYSLTGETVRDDWQCLEMSGKIPSDVVAKKKGKRQAEDRQFEGLLGPQETVY